MGLSTFIPAGIKINETVAASETKDIVLIPRDQCETIKLLVNYKVNTKIKAFEMLISATETDVEDTINARVGNNLNIATNTQIIGTDVVLSVTNNEAAVASVTLLQLN